MAPWGSVAGKSRVQEQTDSAHGRAAAGLPRALNLGCGRQRREGWFNIDRAAQVAPDLIWDLDQYPYPLPDSHFSRIYAGDIVEHLESIPRFMEEAHRVLAPGGLLEITTPHFSCANAYTDPTHRHRLGYFSFDYFIPGGDLDYYASVRFDIVERQIVFRHSALNRIVRRFANRHPSAYEQRFAWMFPAWFLIFRLVALK
jgi:SAM-dependent methyltransferase